MDDASNLRTTAAPPAAHHAPRRWQALAITALAALAIGATVLAWSTRQHVQALEQELVRRQTDSQTQAGEARIAARAAQDLAQAAAAKVALLDARVAETAMQRSQVEELLQSVARARDENIVAEVDAALRVAQQQSALTGSAEPLVAALKQINERLARSPQPRLEALRRAVTRDLERLQAATVIDIPNLTLRLDEAVRLVDELPLLAQAVAPRAKASSAARPSPPAVVAAAEATEAAQPASAAADWRARVRQQWQASMAVLAHELRALVRVSRIDHPEAMLLAPEQQFYVRENLKLRLLNARLALLSRQFDIVQSDLRDAQAALNRYFERSAKRVTAVSELLRQVSTQAQQADTPRPHDTLAALAAATSRR